MKKSLILILLFSLSTVSCSSASKNQRTNKKALRADKKEATQEETKKGVEATQEETKKGVEEQRETNNTEKKEESRNLKEKEKTKQDIQESKNMKDKEDSLNPIWQLEISEEEKKAFQKKLDFSKEKTEILFLPMIHYEKGNLKTLINSVYKAVEKEIQNIHPFIVSRNELYLMETPKKLMEAPKKINKSSSPLFFHFFTENFFDFEKEEYNLKKFVNFINNQPHEKHFDLLKNINAFIETKVLEWEIRTEEKRKEIFYSLRSFRLKALCRLRMRLVSSKSGLTIWENIKEGKIESKAKNFIESSREKSLLNHFDLTHRSLWEAFGKLLPSLIEAIEKLTWKGRVALVSEDKIYINGGKDSGIQIGDVLKITQEEKNIFDPETGEFIGKTQGNTKGFIKVIRHFGEDGSVATIQSGSDFKANDKVKLF